MSTEPPADRDGRISLNVPGFTMLTDPAPADWLIGGLAPLFDGAFTFANLVPAVYEQYCVIEHPHDEGSLSASQLLSVIDVLGATTATPDSVFCCLWHGHGFLDRPQGFDPRACVKWGRSFRRYYLYEGALRSVPNFSTRMWKQGPNIWWPRDRAWCVATEVDLPHTVVGCSAFVLPHLLAAPTLGARQVEPTEPASPGRR